MNGTMGVREQEADGVLAEIRVLIERPEHWTQVFPAKNRGGWLIHPRHPEADSFCLQGAGVRACSDPVTYRDVIHVLACAARRLGLASYRTDDAVNRHVLALCAVTQANDENDHATALRVVDTGKQMLQEGEITWL